MPDSQLKNIIVFSVDIDADKLLISTLNQYFHSVLVIDSYKKICNQLVERTPKVIMVGAETFQRSLAIYYQALDLVDDSQLCEHGFVTLISRHDESEAYEAFSSGIIDDYLVCRPLYEIHRPVMTCNHLLKELGVSQALKDDSEFLLHQKKYSVELKHIVAAGLERKEGIRKAFESSLDNIDKALDNAAEEIQNNQTIQLDMDMLKLTLSAIRSNEIRPELLRLQEKTLDLLQQLVRDMNDLASDGKTETSVDNKLAPEQVAELASASVETLTQYNRLYHSNLDPDEIISEARDIPSILLVEDDSISLNLTAKLLSGFRLKLDTAISGRRAFACMNSHRYDLVLMDIYLPDTNGLYIIKQNNEQEGMNRHTPIIILSSSKNKNTVRKAIEAGAKGYIIKPLYKSSVTKLFEKYKLPLHSRHTPGVD